MAGNYMVGFSFFKYFLLTTHEEKEHLIKSLLLSLKAPALLIFR